MRMAIGPGLVAMLLAAEPVQAMVPPHIQRRGQIQSVIELRALDRFGPINRVELIGDNVWRVTSGRCHIDVTFVERPGPYPGRGLAPPRMEPRAGRQICERVSMPQR
jgi:hypothetical protein